MNNKITINTKVNKSLEEVWETYTNPKHIKEWNFASDDWISPFVTNDLFVGGKLYSRMEARDGSDGFDFIGTYTKVEPMKSLAYKLEDGRNVSIDFDVDGKNTFITMEFEAELENPVDLQKAGWESILYNHKIYTEKRKEI